MLTRSLPIAAVYDRAIRGALLTSVAFGVLCALMLDGGLLRYRCAVALAGFWVGVALIVVRRPLAPSRDDLAFVRWGFLLVFALTIVMADIVRPLLRL